MSRHDARASAGDTGQDAAGHSIRRQHGARAGEGLRCCRPVASLTGELRRVDVGRQDNGDRNAARA